MNKPHKEVTIYHIAEKLNLSASTISKALNNHPAVKEKTRKLVQNTAEEMNFGASNISNPESSNHTIGVIIPHLNRDNMAGIVSGIIDMADQLRYNVILTQSNGSITKESDLMKEMFRKKVDGLLICLAYEKDEMPHFEKFQQYNIPICSFHKVWSHPYASRINIDNHSAATELTNHLIDAGCRKIVHVTALSLNNIYQDRFAGYYQALNDCGLAFDDSMLIKCDLTTEAGEKLALQFMEMDELPDGIIFNDDRCAISCMKVLKDNGIKVPHDILIAGFNNSLNEVYSDPPLTTISFQGYQMGQMALAQLINQINYKGSAQFTPFKLCLEHFLMARKSTLALNRKKMIRAVV